MPEIDPLSSMNSATLNELDRAVTAIIGSDTIVRGNASEVENVTRSIVKDPNILLSDLLQFASSDSGLEQLSNAYDEKEFWMRLFLRSADNYSLRLHIWLPAPGDAVAVETAHNHRRFLVSYVLNNSYTSYQFSSNADNSVELVKQQEIPGGTCYLIKPETIHAISNQTPRHTVSLIVRGNAVKEEIQFFNSDTRSLVEYATQRPIGNIGRTAAEQAMDRKTYLRYRLDRLASESAPQKSTSAS
jgi:hypothetical protein